MEILRHGGPRQSADGGEFFHVSDFDRYHWLNKFLEAYEGDSGKLYDRISKLSRGKFGVSKNQFKVILQERPAECASLPP
jgi:hypothetical protein